MAHEPFRVPEKLREAADCVVQIMSEPTHPNAIDASGSAADDYPLQVDASTQLPGSTGWTGRR